MELGLLKRKKQSWEKVDYNGARAPKKKETECEKWIIMELSLPKRKKQSLGKVDYNGARAPIKKETKFGESGL